MAPSCEILRLGRSGTVGEAKGGPLQGRRLTHLAHRSFQAFSWYAFRTETRWVGDR